MPNVLSKLGADVLAMNPYASTLGVLSFDRDARAAAVADVVRASGAHVGVVLDPDGERVTFIDDEGDVVSDVEALLAFVTMIGSIRESGVRVAVPVVAPSQVNQIAEGLGIEVVGTKLAPAALMAAAEEDGVALAATLDGGFVFPQFLPAFDAVTSLCKLLELLAPVEQSLSQLVAELPASTVVHRQLGCPWALKGLVMRVLTERLKDRELDLTDGIKVIDERGWAEVLPDPDEPLIHVYAEGDSEEASAELEGELHALVEDVMQGQESPVEAQISS
jgi:mannose-1-phosphate guanylyltransferase/phosphomannomutase